jgi:sulfur-oxidizing protein SoxY
MTREALLSHPPADPRRRRIAAALTALGVGPWAVAVREARAQGDAPPAFAAALRQLTGGAPLRDGRVKLDIAPLVENGNAVPVVVEVDSPMSADDRVRRLALLTERNPQPDVAVFQFGALAGRARVATRMRLATTQGVWALAELGDGSWWQRRLEVVVTLAACVEGET